MCVCVGGEPITEPPGSLKPTKTAAKVNHSDRHKQQKPWGYHKPNHTSDVWGSSPFLASRHNTQLPQRVRRKTKPQSTRCPLLPEFDYLRKDIIHRSFCFGPFFCLLKYGLMKRKSRQQNWNDIFPKWAGWQWWLLPKLFEQCDFDTKTEIYSVKKSRERSTPHDLMHVQLSSQRWVMMLHLCKQSGGPRPWQSLTAHLLVYTGQKWWLDK